MKKKKSGRGGQMALKIFGIVGGIGLGCTLLVGGGLFALAMLGSMHSGWQAKSFHGYTIDIPAGKNHKEISQQHPHTTVHELLALRKETGSQYSLVVAKVPAGVEMNLQQIVINMQIGLSNQRPVTRAGVNGLAGKVNSSPGMVPGSESEIFFHNGNLIVTTYSPYSQLQSKIGGKKKTRSNERELDRPDDFFASIKLQ